MKKKGIFVALIIIVVPLAVIYIFIPSKVQAEEIKTFAVPSGATLRCFNSYSKIKEWWPGSELENEEGFTLNGYNFKFSRYTITDLQKITIGINKTDTLISYASINVLGKDSSFISWNFSLETAIGPVKKIKQYLESRRLKKTISSILTSLYSFISRSENIYGVSIKREKIKDSVLIAVKKEYRFYPGVHEIYSNIKLLRQYIYDQHATETNPPICNITLKDSSVYSLIVAIPVSRSINESGEKKIKNLLYNGNILATEIRGGDYTINKTLEAMHNYIDDHELVTAALPYQTLITEREKIKDTSKWETRICYPIY